MKEFIKLVFILFITCGLAAGSLSFINQITREPIANFQVQEKQEALQRVHPQADNFAEVTKNALWEARKGAEKAGYVFLTETQGYGGPIQLVFGIDTRNQITGIQVLTHTETPGLGAKITQKSFQDQFVSKKLENLMLKKDDPAQGAVDAITGATISSRAVVKAIRTALTNFLAGNPAADPAKEKSR